MKVASKYILFFLFGIFGKVAYCQNAYLDSLLQSLAKTADITKTTNILKKICYEYSYTNPDSAVYFGKKAVEESITQNDEVLQVNCIMALAIAYNAQGNYKAALQNFQIALNKCLKLQYNSGIAYCYGGIGNSYKNTGDNLKALEFYNKDLDFEKKIKDKSGIAGAYGNLGTIYENLGNYPKALDNQLMALKISLLINENQIVGNSYASIGNIYIEMKDYEKALEYIFKALSLYEKEKDEYHAAIALSNIGIVYQKKNNYGLALNYEQKSLEIKKRLNDLPGMAISYGNLGELSALIGKYKESLLYQGKALQLKEKLGDKTGITNSLLSFANCFFKQNDFNKALEYSNKALLVAKEIHGLDLAKQAYELLNKCYEKMGNNDLAYQNFKSFIATRDSLFSNETAKEVTQKEMQFNFEKQQTIEKAEQEKKDIEQKAQSKLQRLIILSVIIGLLLVIIFSFFLYKRFRITKRQKGEIEQQKHIVEHKQKEILDSITYAKRIQTALLTSDEYIKNNLPAEHFILFKPKDIVSGDFYWAYKSAPLPYGDRPEEKINHAAYSANGSALHIKEDLAGTSLFYIATADCTGHGVPGAFMSMLNISYFNQNIIERGIRLPHEILNTQRNEIIKALNPPGSVEVSKDGMDCILCGYDFDKMRLHFAAANNPLWLVRSGELLEYKADKMPVGIHYGIAASFREQTIELQKGDIIYTSTDGFVDQFGTNGKKLMKKKFKEELVKIHHQPMSEQKEHLNQYFENWKGSLEQVDDVCVIGIRIL